MSVTRLTQRFVDNLPKAGPPVRDVFYWSETMSGFGVKVKAGSGRISFVYQWRDPRTGASHRLALGDASKLRLDGARKALAEHAAAIAAGRNPVIERRGRRAAPTFADLVEAYLASPTWRAKAVSTRQNDGGRIKRFLLPALGSRKLSEITDTEIKRLHRDLNNPATADAIAMKGGATKRTRRGGEGGARRTLRLLRAIFAYAIEEKLLAANPVAGLRLGSDGARDAAPTAEAYERFWEALERLRAATGSPTLRQAMDVFAIIALTGARKGEIQRLRWRHVDLERRRLTLPAGEHKTGRQTGRSRVIDLPDDAVAILGNCARGQPDELVFRGSRPGSPVALQRPWRRLAAEAGLPGTIVPHSLRHGMGSALAHAGLGAPQIAAQLGHARWRTSERYVHAADRARAELAQRAADLVRPKKIRIVG